MQPGNRLRGIQVIEQGRDHRLGRFGAFGGDQMIVVSQRPIEPVQCLPGLFQPLRRPVQGPAVMGRQQGQPDGLPRMILQNVPDGDDVAQRLGHLFAFHHHIAVVHPDAHEFPAPVRTRALRDLVLVVGKDQVVAAAVDVEGFAQVLLAHGRALQVPARPPAAPRRVPARQVRRRRLPQDEIRRIPFIRRHLHPGAGDDLVGFVPRQLPVARPRGNAEQHVAFGLIGVARRDQGLDHGDHLGDVVGGAGLDLGLQRAQGLHVLVEGPGRALGDGVDALAAVFGGGVDLVVHVGDVAHVRDLGIETLQQPVQHVEDDDRTRVADVGEVVHRGAAHIHADGVPPQRLEPDFPAGQGVMQMQGHGFS